MKSANDVSVAVAEHLAGDVRRFTALMTIRARELGMKRTRFVNPNGLPDERQLSTARDMAILSRAVMRNHPKYYAYFSTPSFTWRGTVMHNHNRLLKTYKGTDGLKTGYTVASGFNLAQSAVRDGRRIIAIVIGGRTAASRDNHMVELLDNAFALLEKRARGERNAQIALATMSNEPDPVAALIQASSEEGSSSERRGVKIVMDDTDAARIEQGDIGGEDSKFLPDLPEKKVIHAKAPKTKAVAAKAEAPAPVAVANLNMGNASIQVGAFDREADAKDKLRRIQMAYGDRMALSRPDVSRTIRNGKTFYRARFTGYDLKEAGQLCRTLQGEGQHCFATVAQ